jgi:hypothetical protein
MELTLMVSQKIPNDENCGVMSLPFYSMTARGGGGGLALASVSGTPLSTSPLKSRWIIPRQMDVTSHGVLFLRLIEFK